MLSLASTAASAAMRCKPDLSNSTFSRSEIFQLAFKDTFSLENARRLLYLDHFLRTGNFDSDAAYALEVYQSLELEYRCLSQVAARWNVIYMEKPMEFKDVSDYLLLSIYSDLEDACLFINSALVKFELAAQDYLSKLADESVKFHVHYIGNAVLGRIPTTRISISIGARTEVISIPHKNYFGRAPRTL